ncbi:MAG TPA: hypothetical protein PKA70_04685 [Saprospiraceae bacterium]|nr:hypothetical protein [Saprospiraceae bacterium]
MKEITTTTEILLYIVLACFILGFIAGIWLTITISRLTRPDLYPPHTGGGRLMGILFLCFIGLTIGLILFYEGWISSS